MTRTILLIGATGAFGSRLARMLAQLSGIALVVTSRSFAKAESCASTLRPAPGVFVQPLAFQHGAQAADAIAAIKPWLVIDASGPFQSATYHTAHAAIRARAHYIDLADSADYILGFQAALDTAARQSGVAAITGASSTPALSCAAASAITAGWSSVDDVSVGIYPAGGSDVGRAVIEAVLSYAGAPVAVRKNSARHNVTGWGTAERVNLPGLGQRYRSHVATADYALMAELLGVRNVSFYAGLESRLEHLGLVAIAKARRYGLIPDPIRLAGILQKSRRFTRAFCGSSGGMLVDAKGVDEIGRPASARWLLVAHNGDGPNVPVLAALAITKKMMQQQLAPGASSAERILSLDEIEAEMKPFAITCSRMTLLPDQPRARSLRPSPSAPVPQNNLRVI